MHERDGDTKKEGFTCPICKKILKYKTSLLRHMRNNHPQTDNNQNATSTGNNNKAAVKDMDILNYNEELSEFSTKLIDTLNDNNLVNEKNNTEVTEESSMVNFEDNFDLQLQTSSNTREICLSMPDIPEVDQQITLSKHPLFATETLIFYYICF